MSNRTLKHWIWWGLGALAAAFVWEFSARESDIVRLWISSPRRLLEYGIQEWPALKWAALYSTGAAVSGLAVAIVTGTAGSVWIARRLEFPAFVRIAVDGISVTPMLVLVPFVTLIVPVGFATAVVMTAIVCFLAYVRLLIDAFARTPSSLRDLVRLYHIPPGRVVRRVLLPYHWRSIFGAVRATVPLALTATVVAEMFGARHGLGRNIFEASIRLNPELFICSTAIVVCLGIILNYAVLLCERKLIKG